MSHYKKVILLTSVLIIVYATIGSWPCEFYNFETYFLTPGYLLIFGIAGFFGSSKGQLGKSALAGLIVGLVHSTVGWTITWQIGLGQSPPELSTTSMILLLVVFVWLLSTFCGLIKKVISSSKLSRNTLKAG